MIIIMSPTSTRENLKRVQEKIVKEGLTYHMSKGSSRTIVGVIGDKKIISRLQMKAFDGVEKTVEITEKYKLVSREFKPVDTIVNVWGSCRRRTSWNYGRAVRCRKQGTAAGSG